MRGELPPERSEVFVERALLGTLSEGRQGEGRGSECAEAEVEPRAPGDEEGEVRFRRWPSTVGISRRVEPYTERTTSPVSDALSDDMRRRGMKFVGSTTVYALLQAAGFIDAHGPECDWGKHR